MNTRGKMMTQTSKTSAIKGKAMIKSKKRSARTPSFSKLKLLASGSLTAAAIILALAPQKASAQAASPSGHSVNANPQITSGNFTLGSGGFTAGPTSDTVTITTDQTVIDWTLFDQSGSDTINFLPRDNSLVFTRDGGADYTVLNRIVPTNQTRGISIDGNVFGLRGGAIGGNIWFYSPGGIIAGDGSNFNVGSLLMTTNAIDTTGGLFGVGGVIRFNGPTGSTSEVSIASGAQINALQDNSYVALVAPRIVQDGTVNVNGSVGYVAAEQADITINNGLFDIAVTVGTESTSGIVHTGTTTGPTRVQTFGPFNRDNQRIYMVAVPKNQAMTMLLSGSIGYTPATGAVMNEQDGSIVLSAGGNVAGTSFSSGIDDTIDPARNASISFANVDFSNDVEAFANNNIVIEDIGAGSITGSQGLNDLDLDFTSGDTIRIEAGGVNGVIDIDGNVTFNTVNGAQLIAREGSFINLGGSLTINAFSETQGGTVDIIAAGDGSGRVTGSGDIVIGEEFIVNAGIAGRRSRFSPVDDGVDTFGGTINLDIIAGGLLEINAGAGFSGSQFDVSAAPNMGRVTAGESLGGTINFNIEDSGSTFTDGGGSGLDLEANGNSGSNFNGTSAGGTNTGGTINFNVTDGIINATSISADASASGTRNADLNFTPTENGANSGDITADFTNATLNINGRLQFENSTDAKAQFDPAGNETAGTAVSGNLDVTFDNTTLTGGQLVLITEFSGAGTAGDLFLNVLNGSSVNLTEGLNLAASGKSPAAGAPSSSGNINLLVDSASLDSASFGLFSSRITRSAADALIDGTTGTVNVTVQNSGSITGSRFFVGANARTNTQGGTATAGDIAINIDGGTMAFVDGPSGQSSVGLSASGSGRSNADDGLAAERGLGVGGNITLTLDNGGSFSAETFSSGTNGSIEDIEEGPISIFGQGGNGVGGLTTFNLISGDFTAGDMSVSSSGFASFGGNSTPFGFPEQLGIVGNGGDGQGGDIVFNLNGADVNVNNLTVSAIGVGGDGGSGRDTEGVAAGDAGGGIGGNATFNANSGSLAVTNTLTLAAGGIGGRGGDGLGVNAGSGGNSVGGTATFNLDGTATISAQLTTISASTDGGRGGDAFEGVPSPTPTPSTPAQRAGDGGNAIAGSAVFNNISGDISFGSMEVTAVGSGGDAGNDPDAPDRFGAYGFPIPAAGFRGQTTGNGGSGAGGNAVINLGQDDASNPIYRIDANGVGAKGGEGNSGGNAGDGIGGTAVLTITDAAVSLDSPVITATGTGGAGGLALTALGDGGNGGNAQGGIARLEIVGAGAAFSSTGEPLVILSNAFGGNGAVGFEGPALSSDGGNGGNGGSATGGTLEIAVRTGADFSLSSGGDFTLSSTGLAGQGGGGGYSYSGAAGDGGNGGQSTGGTARLLAQGGTITGDDVTITTTGQGGDAGSGGGAYVAAGGTFGSTGMGGIGAGGTAAIEVQEGSPGIITLGDVNLIANGFNAGDGSVPTGIGGRIEITDTSTDPAGLISFSSLNVEALAFAASNSGFFMSSDSGAISVANDLTVNVAGNAEFAYDGNGQLVVGGLMDVMSGESILVTHSNNAVPTTSIDVAGTFNAIAALDFTSTDGSRINSDDIVTVRAERNATVADIAGVGTVDISALQNVTVNNAAVTGTPFTFSVGIGTLVGGPQLVIQAGFDPNGTPSPNYDPSANATITGNATSTGNIVVNAGGNAIFAMGSNTISDNGLTVQTGDDIIIQSGASVVAGADAATTPSTAIPFSNFNNLVLQAGGLGPLTSTPLTPIASIVAAGDINANDFAVIMSASAIDGLGGTITASSIAADINDAPSNAFINVAGQSDDNDLLSASCVEGNLCLGALAADNIISIGQAGVPIQAIIESGDIVANRILISTRRDIVMGADGVPSRFIASDEIFVNSTEGDVDLRDAALTSDTLGIEAAGSLLGSGSLNSGNDIGITVSGSISAAAINTGGELTTVTGRGGAQEGFYSVPDSMNVGILTVGVGDVNYDAGGDLSFDQINVPGTDIILSAPGSVFVGGTSGAENIDIDADSIGLGAVSANNDINLVATSTIDFGSVSAGNLLDMAASDISGDIADGNEVTVSGDFSVDVNSISAGDTLVVDALDITLGDADGSTVSISGNDILIGGVSGGFVSIDGSQISIDGASASDLSISGGDIGVGSMFADNASLFGDAVFVGSAEGGELDIFAQTRLDVNDIDIDGNAMLEATGPMVIGTAITGGNASLVAETVTLNAGNIAGDLTMEATAGDIDGSGIVAVGGAIDLDATGDIGFGSLSAGTTFDATAGGAITFAAAGADGNLTLIATTNVSGGDVSSGDEAVVGGTEIDLDSLSGNSFARFNANGGDATINRIDSGSGTIFGIARNGSITVDRLIASTSIRLEGADGIEVNSASGANGVFLAADGDIAVREDAAFSNLFTARGNSVFVRSNGSLKTVAEATVGDIDIVTAGDLSVDDASAVGNISLTSLRGSAELNDIIVGNAAFGGTPAGISSQAVVSANGNIDITAAVDATVNSTINAASALTITAGNLIDIQALTTGTTINLSSADINIGTSGQLGEFTQTNDIFIESNGINRVILGGAGTAGVFSLDNDEFTRIQSNQDLTLFVAQTGNSTPDLIIQDLTIQAGDNVSGPQSATIGFSGALTIDSGQSTRVDGNLNLTNASAGTSLNITAVNDLRINANGGLIQITDGSGNFGGVGLMTLTTQNIYAMTDQAFADIAGLGVNAVDARLANSDGLDLENGLIRGGFAEFVVDGDLFIQNTVPGVSFDERRGFTVDTLTINGLSAGSNANIGINGIVGGQTGIDGLLQADVAVAFDDFSTINGCVIIDPASCGGGPTPTPTPTTLDDPGIDDPVQDIIEEEVTPSNNGSVVSDPFETNLIEIKETKEFVDDPLIDDPVTGAGNDDLWVIDKDAGGDGNGECEDGDESCGPSSAAAEEELEPAE